MMDLRDKNVVVTGGSYGIGKEIARAFLAQGANVFVVARGQEKLRACEEELRKEFPGRNVRGYRADVSEKEEIKAVMDEIAAEGGGIQVLVNNAGIVIPGYFQDLPIEDFEKVMRTNYLGAVYATKAALPHLLRNRESAVTFTSSPAGIKGLFGYSTYSPTKAALIALAEVIRAELGSRGLRVCVLCPPDTDTPGFQEEIRVRPRETEAIAGSAPPRSPREVAECFMRGFKKGKFLVLCDFNSRLLYRLNGISPRLVDFILDRMASKGRAS
jgi:3-dehydrosphinganine reductase